MWQHAHDREVRTRAFNWSVYSGRTRIGTYASETEARVHSANAPGTYVAGSGA